METVLAPTDRNPPTTTLTRRGKQLPNSKEKARRGPSQAAAGSFFARVPHQRRTRGALSSCGKDLRRIEYDLWIVPAKNPNALKWLHAVFLQVIHQIIVFCRRVLHFIAILVTGGDAVSVSTAQRSRRELPPIYSREGTRQ